MRRPRTSSGQASVELVAALPALLLAAFLALQLLAAGYAMTLADGAAEAGALALASGRSAADAARGALPGWARDDVDGVGAGRPGDGAVAPALAAAQHRRPPGGHIFGSREAGRMSEATVFTVPAKDALEAGQLSEVILVVAVGGAEGSRPAAAALACAGAEPDRASLLIDLVEGRAPRPTLVASAAARSLGGAAGGPSPGGTGRLARSALPSRAAGRSGGSRASHGSASTRSRCGRRRPSPAAAPADGAEGRTPSEPPVPCSAPISTGTALLPPSRSAICGVEAFSSPSSSALFLGFPPAAPSLAPSRQERPAAYPHGWWSAFWRKTAEEPRR